MTKIKVGLNGAEVTEFVLRSEHNSEVKIKRVPTYDADRPEEWTVQISDARLQQGGNTLAHVEGTVEDAQDFARKVLDTLDKVHEARRVEREAMTAARNVIRNQNAANRLRRMKKSL